MKQTLRLVQSLSRLVRFMEYMVMLYEGNWKLNQLLTCTKSEQCNKKNILNTYIL